jgi:hypothetical protein
MQLRLGFTYVVHIYFIFTVKMNTPGTSVQDQSTFKSLDAIGLLQIVQNLIALGLNSLELWNTVIPKLKAREEFSSNPELINLHLLLTRISQHLYSNLFKFFPNDLSQEKLPNLLAKEIPSSDLIKKVKPLLNKKSFVDRTFSMEASNLLNNTVQDIISSLRVIDMFENDDVSVIEENSQKRARRLSEDKRPSKKPRMRSPSPSQSEASSTSSEISDSDSGSDLESDKFDKLFKIKSSKSVPKIKQMFQTQNKKVKRKLTTPGEEGRYMIKIELTDTKDLKKCKMNQYWQKVNTKAVFLAEPKSELYKKINNMLFSVGQKIKSMPGVESDEMKLDKRS